MAAMVVSSLVYGQNYPPGQYPPGQYPPSQYPGQYPGQYPPNTTRLPGPVPIGIPVPEIKIPKRGEKSDKKSEKKKPSKDSKDVTITLVTIEGSLRKLADKEMVVDSAEKGIVRFRLLAKTQFRDKAGEPIRDSLLKPGDQLQVQVNPDDEETALRVTLVREGTPAERAAASQPVDPATSAASDKAGTASKEPAIGDEPRPKLQRKPEEPAAVDFGRKEDAIIAEAREAAFEFTDSLPNFIVQQFTTRWVSSTRPPQWTIQDLVSTEVAYVDGKEEYRNVAINGRKTKYDPMQTGTWSTGEFASTLQDVLSPLTNAAFVRRGEENVGSRPAHVYDYTVKQPNSHWQIFAIDRKKSYKPAYAGAIWIDKENRRVLRVELRALSLPADFEFDKAQSTIEYGFVRIDQKTYLLPSKGESVLCHTSTTTCTRNEIVFQNYRRFTADSQIQFPSRLVSLQ